MPSFQRKIRMYNSAFAFTSMGATVSGSLRENRTGGGGGYNFRINGSVHHRIGALLPSDQSPPAFAQIYLHDGDMVEQQHLRCMIFSNVNDPLDYVVVGDIKIILSDINPLMAAFMSAREFARTAPERRLVLLSSPNVDPRRYNQPTSNEVAAIIVHGTATASHRDVVLHNRGGGFQRIYETNPYFDPLQYPLIYLRGEVGWSPDSKYRDGVERNGNSKVSLREHTAFRLFFKHPCVEYSLLHRAGRLMQQ